MESSRGPGGIQQLLAAEQEAQHIVNAARSGRLATFGLTYFHSCFIFISIYNYKLISLYLFHITYKSVYV